MSDKPLETLLEEKELAETLQVSIGTLRTWRSDGTGPAVPPDRPDDPLQPRPT